MSIFNAALATQIVFQQPAGKYISRKKDTEIKYY